MSETGTTRRKHKGSTERRFQDDYSQRETPLIVQLVEDVTKGTHTILKLFTTCLLSLPLGPFR